MKNLLLKYRLPISIYVFSILFIYLHQQSLIVQNENLLKITGIYKKIALKKERHNPAKFYLENDGNVYVLKKNAYKAWTKHYFLKTAEKGDELVIEIDKQYSKLLSQKKNQVINIVTMRNANKALSYLTLNNYNSHQKAGHIKLYMLATFFFLIFIFIKNTKKKTYKL